MREDLKKKEVLASIHGMIADYFFNHGFGNVNSDNSYMLVHIDLDDGPCLTIIGYMMVLLFTPLLQI
jgi:hypothetical protein